MSDKPNAIFGLPVVLNRDMGPGQFALVTDKQFVGVDRSSTGDCTVKAERLADGSWRIVSIEHSPKGKSA